MTIYSPKFFYFYHLINAKLIEYSKKLSFVPSQIVCFNLSEAASKQIAVIYPKSELTALGFSDLVDSHFPVNDMATDLLIANIVTLSNTQPDIFFQDAKRILKTSGLLLFATFDSSSLDLIEKDESINNDQLICDEKQISERLSTVSPLYFTSVKEHLLATGKPEEYIDCDLFFVSYPKKLKIHANKDKELPDEHEGSISEIKEKEKQNDSEIADEQSNEVGEKDEKEVEQEPNEIESQEKEKREFDIEEQEAEQKDNDGEAGERENINETAAEGEDKDDPEEEIELEPSEKEEFKEETETSAEKLEQEEVSEESEEKDDIEEPEEVESNEPEYDEELDKNVEDFDRKEDEHPPEAERSAEEHEQQVERNSESFEEKLQETKPEEDNGAPPRATANKITQTLKKLAEAIHELGKKLNQHQEIVATHLNSAESILEQLKSDDLKKEDRINKILQLKKNLQQHQSMLLTYQSLQDQHKQLLNNFIKAHEKLLEKKAVPNDQYHLLIQKHQQLLSEHQDRLKQLEGFTKDFKPY